MEFPVATDGDTTSEGALREYMMTYEDAEGIEHKEVWLELKWRTGGESYGNYWIQTYMQMEDPMNPGMFMAMTCTAEYDKGDDFATEV